MALTSNALQRLIAGMVFALMPARVAEALAIVFGLIAVVTPLAMWVAWTQAIFLYVILGGAIACGLSCLLNIATTPEHPLLRPPARPNDDVARLRSIKRKPDWRGSA